MEDNDLVWIHAQLVLVRNGTITFDEWRKSMLAWAMAQEEKSTTQASEN